MAPTHPTNAPRFSKHDLAGLAVAAAIQFERAAAGSTWDGAKLHDLARELRLKAEPLGNAPFRLVEPGYLGALTALAQFPSYSVDSVEAVQARVAELAQEIERFAGDSSVTAKERAVELRDVCLSFHRGLLEELQSERDPSHDGQDDLRYAAAAVPDRLAGGVRAAQDQRTSRPAQAHSG